MKESPRWENAFDLSDFTGFHRSCRDLGTSNIDEKRSEFAKWGTSVASAKRLKSSFHSTWLVEVSPGMIQDDQVHALY